MQLPHKKASEPPDRRKTVATNLQDSEVKEASDGLSRVANTGLILPPGVGTRRVYAHWLDPEYTSFRWPRNIVKQRLQKILGVLKLRAILGDTVVVSDMQVTDSRAVLELFCDQQFLKFLREKPGFLCLVGEPTTSFGASDQALQILEMALERTLRKYWQSSTFRDKRVPQEVARWIKRKRCRNAGSFCTALRNFPPPQAMAEHEGQLLAGMLEALAHFAGVGAHVEPSVGIKSGPSTYYEVLQQVESDGNIRPKFHDEIASTLDFLKPIIRENKHAKISRSPAVSKLQGLGLDNPVNYKHLAHIIQAWSLPPAARVGATRQDVPAFWGAVPLPAFFGNVTEVTAPGVTFDEGGELFKLLDEHDWQPADLSWEAVRRVRRDDKMRGNIERFQAQPSPDLLKKVLSQAGHIVGSVGSRTSSLLVSSEGGLAKALFHLRQGVSVSQKRIEELPPPVRLTAKLILPHADLCNDLLECAELAFAWSEANAAAEILESYAVRYNLIKEEQEK